jgi:hypothetical protein
MGTRCKRTSWHAEVRRHQAPNHVLLFGEFAARQHCFARRLLLKQACHACLASSPVLHPKSVLYALGMSCPTCKLHTLLAGHTASAHLHVELPVLLPTTFICFPCMLQGEHCADA